MNWYFYQLGSVKMGAYLILMLWNTAHILQNGIYRSQPNSSWHFFNFLSSISSITINGVKWVLVHAVKTAHNAVEYCTNIPNLHDRWKIIECLYSSSSLSSSAVSSSQIRWKICRKMMYIAEKWIFLRIFHLLWKEWLYVNIA